MTRVTVRGPVFDGEADEAARQWIEDFTGKLAAQGAAIVRDKAMKMNRSRRGGTGGAASTVSHRSEGMSAVVEGQSHQGLVWWPWLEGTSKRNSTTRFRGYHAFRLAKNIMRKRAQKVAEDRLHEYLPRMGGDT
jgi:hypothetical protein